MTPSPHVHKRVECGQLNLQWNTFAMQRTGFVRAAGLRLPTKEVIITLVEASTLVLPRVASRRGLSFHGPIHMFNQAHRKIGMQAFDECWLISRDGTIEQIGGYMYPVPFQELCNGVAVRRDMIQVCVAFHLSCHGVTGWKYQSDSGNTAANKYSTACHARSENSVLIILELLLLLQLLQLLLDKQCLLHVVACCNVAAASCWLPAGCSVLQCCCSVARFANYNSHVNDGRAS